jgi:hypothetical protein
MNSNPIFQPVYPNIKVNKTIVRMSIQVIELVLFERLSMSVLFFDSNDKLIDAKQMILDKTNGYDEWSNDDKFVVEWVKKELSLGIYS